MDKIEEAIFDIWQNEKEAIEENFSCYRHKNSTGQKSGIFLIDNKLVIDIHYYDDTSITCSYAINPNIVKKYLIDDGNGIVNFIINNMFVQLKEEMVKKEKEYKTYQFYQNLAQTVKNIKIVKNEAVKIWA